MRAMMVVVATAATGLCISVSLADTLPASCGKVGAQGYQTPQVPAPVVVTERGTVVTVTTASMASNGDVSSIRALQANPGPDGISLYEAITASNNARGVYTIRFAPQLMGVTIHVNSLALTPLNLLGGNVIVNGDIDGDGKPDITLLNEVPANTSPITAFQISSSGNTLHALTLQGYARGVLFKPPSYRTTKNTTFDGNVVSNLVMNGLRLEGINLGANFGELPPFPQPAVRTGNTWQNTVLVGNRIETQGSGIFLTISGTASDRLEHTTIVNNTIRITGAGQTGIGAGATGFSIASNDNRMLDTLIAYNSIEAVPIGAGIRVSAGEIGAQDNLVDGVRIIGNRIRFSAPTPSNEFPSGILLVNGDGATDFFDPNLRPIIYSDKNIMRNVAVLGNTVEGYSGQGIGMQGACCGSISNTTTDISIVGNVLHGLVARTNFPFPTGIQIIDGTTGGFYSRVSSGNEVSRVLIQFNSIQMTGSEDRGNVFLPGGVVIWTGRGASSNRVSGVQILNNEVDTPLIGINLIGGWSLAPEPDALDNLLSLTQVRCNVISRPPTLAAREYPDAKGISLAAGFLRASGNRLEAVSIGDNLVAGVLDDVSVFPNLDAPFARGTSGNSISFASISGPATVPRFAAASAVNGASFQSPSTPGSFAALFGANLATTTASGSSSTLPTSLAGTSLQLNGIAAPLTFASPGQVNFQVPWELAGRTLAALTVTVNSVTGPPQTVALAAYNPGLFVTNAQGQGAIVNLQGKLVDPAAAARSGDALEIFATGLGPVTNQPATGAPATSGPFATTTVTPTVTIGGVPAPVLFAGLAPGFVGLYQVNVQVPDRAPTGDAVPVQLSIAGASSNVVAIAVR